MNDRLAFRQAKSRAALKSRKRVDAAIQRAMRLSAMIEEANYAAASPEIVIGDIAELLASFRRSIDAPTAH